MASSYRCNGCHEYKTEDRQFCRCGANDWQYMEPGREEFEELLGDDAWDNTD